RNQATDTAPKLGHELRRERHPSHALRLRVRDFEIPLLFPTPLHADALKVRCLGPAQLAPAKRGTECQAAHESVGRFQRGQLRRFLIGQPVRRPLLKPGHHPARERTLFSTSPESSHQWNRQRTSESTCHTLVTLSLNRDSTHSRKCRTSSRETRSTSMCPKNGSMYARTRWAASFCGPSRFGPWRC